jgi:hypothetical protein
MDTQDTEPRESRDEKMIRIIRGLANGIGVILFLVMLISAFEMGGLDRLISLNGKETITFVCILTMFFGIVWAHQKEIAGAILIIIAYIVLAINLGKFFPDAIVPIFLFVGILHLYAGIMSINKSA